MKKAPPQFAWVAKSKVLVIGNICAGKTTLIQQLCPLLNGTPAILDEFRRQYGDGSIAGDYLAYYHLLLACAKPSPNIIEFSGAGPHKWAIRLALKESRVPCAVVFVDTPVQTCITRALTKKFDVPYPAWDISPADIIPALQQELEEDCKQGFWTTFPHFVFTSYQDNCPVTDLVNSLDQAIKKLEDPSRARIK